MLWRKADSEARSRNDIFMSSSVEWSSESEWDNISQNVLEHKSKQEKTIVNVVIVTCTDAEPASRMFSLALLTMSLNLESL